MLFRRKSTDTIEAFRYDGDLKVTDVKYYVPDWAVEAFETGVLHFEDGELMARTVSLECNPITVPVGCYIIHNKCGGLGFISAKEFEDMYEPVSEEQA